MKLPIDVVWRSRDDFYRYPWPPRRAFYAIVVLCTTEGEFLCEPICRSEPGGDMYVDVAFSAFKAKTIDEFLYYTEKFAVVAMQ